MSGKFVLTNRALLAAAVLSVLGFSPAAGAYHSIDTPEVEVSAEKLQPLPAFGVSLQDNDLAGLRTRTSDAASLLDGQPGISLYQAGGVSSLPAIHGLADDRIRIKVDGMDLISACANHMNPPLSYIDPSNVAVLKVFAGITPVSAGGDSIAGTITADSAAPEFAQPGETTLIKGRLGTFFRSNNQAYGVNLSASAASENFYARYTGSTTQAENYKAGRSFKPAGLAAVSMIPGGNRGWLDGDEVGSTAYKAQNHAVAFGLRRDNHLLELKLGLQNIPYQGFPSQRMDMTDNDSRQINLRYTGQFDWGTLQARAWHERTRHRMNFGDDKLYLYASMMMMQPVPGMPMDTEGRNTGLSLKGDVILSQRDILRVGAEYQRYRLDDWWAPVANAAPMMGPGTFWNIRDGQRDRYAAYAEWEAHWNTQWTTQFGVRHETVKVDTGRVQGYSPMGGMMGYGNPNNPASIPGAFNAADRSKSDSNLDLTALAHFTPDQTSSYEVGYARKTRSPNLYERYVWSTNNSMVTNMNNWYGDGNGYVGNLNLKPEVAHTLSLAGNWHDAARDSWNLQVSPYYSRVENYIDAVPCTSVGKTCPPRGDGFLNLSLANQTARLYGADVSGRLVLGHSADFGKFSLSGVLNYVKGKNLTSGDHLYHIMPPNLKLALAQRVGGWNNTVEVKLVDAKDNVANVRKEQKTAGYGLLNLYSSYAWKQARLDVGIENVFDRYYNQPLGGAYLGQGATMGTGIPYGTRVPGMGRSINVGLTLDF